MNKLLNSFLILFVSFFLFISCQKTVDTNSSDIAVLKASVTALLKTTDSLSKALATTNNNVSNLSSKLDSIKAQIVIVQSQITILNSQLTITNTNITNINAQIIILNQQYIFLLAQLNAILAQLTIIPNTLSTGLIAYYPFTGNANDSSGNGNHGTVNGATLNSDRFGNANKAYAFNGINSFIEIPSNTIFDNLNGISISAWIKINSWCAPNVNGVKFFPVLAQYATNPSNQYGKFGLQLTESNLNYFYFNSNNYNYNQTNPNYWSLGKWINVLVSANNGITKWYLNGVNINTVNGVGFGTSLAGLSILIGRQTPSSNSLFSNGLIDDIRIYNRALTQEEITYIANN